MRLPMPRMTLLRDQGFIDDHVGRGPIVDDDFIRIFSGNKRAVA